MRSVRVAFDVTSLLGARTGVGAFAGEVLARVARGPDLEVVGYSVSWRGRGRAVGELLPDGVRTARAPMAARPLRELWRRTDWPPIEWWTGTVDVVHGPNFVVPPSHRSRAAELATVHDLTCVRFPELCTRDTLQYPDLIRRALRRGAHLHAVSHFVRDEILETFDVDPERVHVVANGVDPVRQGDAAAGRARAGGDRYVLALGTVEPRKDYPLLVAAFDELAASDSDVRLVVAGQDGWGAEAFTAAIERAHHRDRVVRTGWIDDRARADLLAGAHVFAYPSKYEGFGLPPLEAMAAGTPVVATRAGALPEVLGDGARLVTPGDAGDLAAAIQLVLDDETERKRLVEAGRARVEHYSWDACAEGVVNLYRRLC
jgi:glycosyltransferase involved in cell wall biosynthesis